MLVTIFLPLIGSLIILFIKEDEKSSINIKWAALITSLGTFTLSCLIWFIFENIISQEETCFIDPKKIVFLSAETSYADNHFLKEATTNYLNQFAPNQKTKILTQGEIIEL